MKTILATILFLTLPLGLTADIMGHENTSEGWAGIYNLVSIDGNPIPFSPMHEGRPIPVKVVSSTMTLVIDSTFTMKMTYQSTDDSTKIWSQDFKGTIASNGNSFIFTWEGAGQTEVPIEGDELVLNNEGTLFEYRKRQ